MMVFHRSLGSFGGGLSLKDAEVVTSARQRYVRGTRPSDLENVSGAEMPVMLEGVLTALAQIPKNEKDHRSDRWSQKLKGFSLAIALPCDAS